MSDLRPGPEMDAAVAKAVGWKWMNAGRGHAYSEENVHFERKTLRHPSNNTADAIAALEAWHGAYGDPHYLIERQPGGFTVSLGIDLEVDGDSADTIPEAACRAILAWAEGVGDG